MEFLNDLSQNLYVWVIFQTLVIAIAIITTAKRGVARLYALFFIFLSIESSLQFIYSHVELLAPRFALFMFFYEFFNLLYGPLVLVSLLWSFTNRFDIKKAMFHGSLSVVFLIYYFVVIVLPNRPFDMFAWIYTPSHMTWSSVCTFSVLFYFFYISYVIRKNAGFIPNVFTKPLLGYLLLKGANGLIVMVHMNVFRFDLISEGHIAIVFCLTYIFCNAYIIVMTMVLLFSRNNIFSTDKIHHSNVSDLSEFKENIDELHRLMKEEKVFARHDVSMEMLAEMISVPIHTMSRILNESIGLSFWDYINAARIEMAQELLKDSEEKNLSVAIRCGYNSESVFYRNFRKQTGFTPKKFQELHSIGD